MKRTNQSELQASLYSAGFNGEINTDYNYRILFATDASVYREIPHAVVYPKDNEDIKILISFARRNKIGLIPRTAGTSLAGQVVGSGIVVDVSKYFNKIIEINIEGKWVRVQPGVVLDELNAYLKQYNLFFGPETSTANRCMIGGMIGNNACGAHSLVYGSTRDHIVEIKGFLSDSSEVFFKDLNIDEFESKCNGDNLECNIYKNIKESLCNQKIRQSIIDEFPDKKIKRRNTGYAVDVLLESNVFNNSDNPFNFSKLIAGSEGTLFFITEAKLNLVDLPPKSKGLLCVHFNSLEDSIQGNLIALKYKPVAIELIDNIIVRCLNRSIEHQKNRFFIEGDPKAILLIEFIGQNDNEIIEVMNNLEQELRSKLLGYHFPKIFNDETRKVWNLRKAALGLLSNLPGDAKPVSLIEDTAVNIEFLASYISEFKLILEKFKINCVFHGHISTGELHLRPVLNLKDEEHRKIFRKLALEVAYLVKKYKGSLSGEHGDGRLRGEFISIILGQNNYDLLINIKNAWDPDNIFNPGKIVNTPLMDSSFRYEKDYSNIDFTTCFDYSDSLGFQRHIERCNGSADCLKSQIIGGTMCPSYMATRKESDSTRGRANTLREYLSYLTKPNPVSLDDVKGVLDLCLSCKACKTECPSNVDMTKLKAEFLQYYYDKKGIPLRSWLIGNMTIFYKLGSTMPSVFNFFISNKTFSHLLKYVIGFAQERNIPLLQSLTVSKWCKKHLPELNRSISNPHKEVYLFIDEFTEYIDSSIGIKAIQLLSRLGYRINIAPCIESGRTSFSKGLIKKARTIAIRNVNALKVKITSDVPLLGIEPSSILTFRDEYPEIVPEKNRKDAIKIAENTLLIEEFIAAEIEKDQINKQEFTNVNYSIVLHGHCYQKALATTKPIVTMLSFPKNYKVIELPTGCCGMAGAFGFESEHYELSMKIGELVLFPAIRNTPNESIIAASGTSCRHQILEGTGRIALHPIEILYEALQKK
jgi:FAD/FMN-containing dehydrogenase/Fe-S oxidoreductase